MAVVHYYRWNAWTDTIWHVCSRHLLASGFGDLPDFVEAVRVVNPDIKDWQGMLDNQRIKLPFPE